ncbi:MAG TPA: S53 family peptidase [Candidatus Melainabacteria bacterium]|nr:S53 family peptidase [Candidatus Melainabacteria bacterium]
MGGQDSVLGRKLPTVLDLDNNGNDFAPEDASLTLAQAAGLGGPNLTDTTAAPDSKLSRYAQVTVEGVKNLPSGIGHSVWHSVTHPMETAEMVASSAVLGAVLKTGLPERGPAGLIAGTLIGGYFLYTSAEPIGNAYKKAGEAKTMGDLHAAGRQLGEAGGEFIVNTGIAVGGYRLGAGATNRLLMGERFDGFMEAKHNFWTAVDGKLSTKWNSLKGNVPLVGDSLPTANTLSLQPKINIVGDRSQLLFTDRAAPKGNILGEVDPAQTIDVSVSPMTKGSSYLMDRYINRISRGSTPLSDAQIEAKFGAKSESVEAIKKLAAEHNLQVKDVNMVTGRMVLSGDAASMENAFGTKLQMIEHESGVRFRGRTGPLSVQNEYAPHIRSVLGLDNRPQFHTNYVRLNPISENNAGSFSIAGGADAGAIPKPGHATKPGQPSGFIPHEVIEMGKESIKPPESRPVTPQEIMQAYNAPEGFTGEGMSTGFLSLGGTLPKGWQAYLESKQIDPSTVKIRNTSKVPLESDPKGANGENALDLFIHKEPLPKAETVMIAAENNDAGMPVGILRAAFPEAGEKQISHFSISWGMSEDGWTRQALKSTEDAARRAALKGTTVTVAAGDDGAWDRSPTRKQQVDVPAGLANVTAAGGTRLWLNADGSWAKEEVWRGSGATGGGRSMKTPRPDYQKGLKMPANLNGSKFDGRGVPDASAVADPRSGILTYTDFGIDAIGGTSAAAPELAVAAAMISKMTGKPTGFWNPELYRLGKEKPSVFRDVTVGDNTDGGIKGYPATKGWDASTGWGTPHIQNYIDTRNSLFNQTLRARSFSAMRQDLLNNHTGVPVWAVPYQSGSSTASDSNR